MFVCYHSLEHFLHPSKVVGEIKKNILPGGYVVVVVPELCSKNAGKRNDAQIELNSFGDLKILFEDTGFVLKDACLEANNFSFKSQLFIFQETTV
jgi:hypothetical protein